MINMKIPYSKHQKKVMRDFTKDSISQFYNVTPRLKLYMFYCRVMERVWYLVHPFLHGKLKFSMYNGLTIHCTHRVNFRRAYNDLKDFEKNIDKLTW